MKPTGIPKICIIIFLCLMVLTPVSFNAQEEIQINEYAVEIRFPDNIEVVIKFNDNSQLRTGRLFLQSRNSNEVTQINNAVIDGNTISWLYDLNENTTLTFFEITNFWIEVEYSEGQLYTSPVFAFFFADSRFEWEQVGTDNLVVYTPKEQTSYAENFLQTTTEILDNLYILDGLAKPDEFKLVVYPDTNGIEAIPSSLVDRFIVQIPAETPVSFNNQQKISLELLNQIIMENYDHSKGTIPDWIRIGAATSFGLSPADVSVLQTAVLEPSKTQDVTELCEARIPEDLHNPLMAAQTSSMLGFLEEKYGIDSFYSIIGSAVNGTECDKVLDATGISSDRVLQGWKVNTFTSTKNVESPMPWFLLLAIVCVPVFTPLVFKRKRR